MLRSRIFPFHFVPLSKHVPRKFHWDVLWQLHFEWLMNTLIPFRPIGQGSSKSINKIYQIIFYEHINEKMWNSHLKFSIKDFQLLFNQYFIAQLHQWCFCRRMKHCGSFGFIEQASLNVFHILNEWFSFHIKFFHGWFTIFAVVFGGSIQNTFFKQFVHLSEWWMYED